MAKRLKKKSQEGFLIVLVLLVLTILVVIGFGVSTIGAQSLNFSQVYRDNKGSMYAADAGIARGIKEVFDNPTSPSNITGTLNNGATYSVIYTNNVSGTSSISGQVYSVVPAEYIEIVSTGDMTNNSYKTAILMHVILSGEPEPDEVFQRAAYIGNADITFGGNGEANLDVVGGDLHCNGNIYFNEQSTISGTPTATGTITGAEGFTGGDDRIAPVDFSSIDYASDPDVVNVSAEFAKGTVTQVNTGQQTEDPPGPVGPDTDFNGTVTTVSSDNPAHIFAKGVINDYGLIDSGGPLGNENYTLGDWHNTQTIGKNTYRNGQNITVSEADNDKVYYVDGNLWIDDNGYGPTLSGPEDGAKVTIVVKGNIYVADSVNMSSDNDALVLIALNDTESFTDQNHNHRYDEGEPILNDQGTIGTYEGPIEGSGNIYLGNPNNYSGSPKDYNPTSINAFMYAENNVEDYNVNNFGWSLSYTINGSLGAGNKIDLHRDVRTFNWGTYENSHGKLTINFDDRLQEMFSNGYFQDIPFTINSDDPPEVTVTSWRKQ